MQISVRAVIVSYSMCVYLYLAWAASMNATNCLMHVRVSLTGPDPLPNAKRGKGLVK